jgi:hypothetical protein
MSNEKLGWKTLFFLMVAETHKNGRTVFKRNIFPMIKDSDKIVYTSEQIERAIKRHYSELLHFSKNHFLDENGKEIFPQYPIIKIKINFAEQCAFVCFENKTCRKITWERFNLDIPPTVPNPDLL